MSESAGPERFSEEHRAGLEARRSDRDRTLDAMHSLEAALSAAAPGREADWRRSVVDALAALDAATAEEGRRGRRTTRSRKPSGTPAPARNGAPPSTC